MIFISNPEQAEKRKEVWEKEFLPTCPTPRSENTAHAFALGAKNQQTGPDAPHFLNFWAGLGF